MSLLAHHQMLMAVSAPALDPLLWNSADAEGPALVVSEGGRTLTLSGAPGGGVDSIRCDPPFTTNRYFEIDVVSLSGADDVYMGALPGWTAISSPASSGPYTVFDTNGTMYTSPGAFGGAAPTFVAGDRLQLAARRDAGQLRVFVGVVGANWGGGDPTTLAGMQVGLSEDVSHPGEMRWGLQTTGSSAVLRLVPRAEFLGVIPAGYDA